MQNPLAEGDLAPDFTAQRDGGASFTLSALRGRKVALYFYPKDDTPGCTTQACDFTAAKAEFDAAGAVVAGVSRDSARKHDAFKAKHALDVVLVADEDGAICDAYGVWVEKSMYGKKYMGVERSTFLIDEEGRLTAIMRKVSPKNHSAAVLAQLRA